MTESKDMRGYISFPEVYTRRKLNALYREIPLKDTTSRLLRKYFNAMASLYGVITLGKAYSIVSSQNPNLVTEDEFRAFAEIARHECEHYKILGEDEIYTDGKNNPPLFEREIVYEMIVDYGVSSYVMTKELQESKPFYIPEKKELLVYNDILCEDMPEADRMCDYLKDRFNLSETDENTVFYLIWCCTQFEESGDILKKLEEMGYKFGGKEDEEKFCVLYDDFYGNVRMYGNRGYTQKEICKMQPQEEVIPTALAVESDIRGQMNNKYLYESERLMSIGGAEFPSNKLIREITILDALMGNDTVSEKIGRNEPCPCGSGKKYKKCCGKKF